MLERVNATMRLLLFVVAADAVVSVAVGVGGLVTLLAGHRGWPNVLAAASLSWPAVLAVALVRGRRTALWLRERIHNGDERLAAVAAMSQVWLWEATPDLVATYCGPACAEIIGRTPEEIVGRPLFDFMHEQDLPRARAVQAAGVRAGIGWTDVDLRWWHADGRLLSLRGSAVPVLDDTGQVAAFRGIRRTPVSDTGAAEQHRAAASDQIRDVLRHETLTVALQPIVDLTDGRWCGVEALARFPGDDGPDVWFAQAAEVGLGIELEQLALRKALATVGQLPAGVRVSVNASPEMVLHPSLGELLTTSGVPLDRITLEITEHEPVTRYDDIHAALRPLRGRGLHLAVDDTGAGYASFQHVLQLRPDIVKLDRSLLRNITSDPACRALVTAIVLLALELKATVTAEGVESLDELNTLASLGIDQAQGYLLARPDTDAEVWRSWPQHAWPLPQRAIV